MKKKQILTIAVVVIVLAGIASTTAFVNEASYRYLRIKNGTTMNLSGQCFVVPERWIVQSIETRDKRLIYNLRAKEGDTYISSSVMSADATLTPSVDDANSAKFKSDTFTVYELMGLPKDNEARYWSFISAHNLVVLGTSVDILKNLSSSIKKTNC